MPEDHRSDTSSECQARARWYPTPEVRVVNPEPSKTVPQGEQGELWFRSKQLMKGYHNKPEATAEAVTADGWFRTGDIGRVDGGGYIFVEDRPEGHDHLRRREHLLDRGGAGAGPSIPLSWTSRSSACPTTNGARL